jgi:hypothetical protein
MAANPRQELRNLVDRLSDDAAAELLAVARQVAARRGALTTLDDGFARRLPGGLVHTGRSDPTIQNHEPPVLRRGRPIASLDELRGDVFPPEESQAEFEATLRRWRDEPERG